jgi:hypothetical protein
MARDFSWSVDQFSQWMLGGTGGMQSGAAAEASTSANFLSSLFHSPLFAIDLDPSSFISALGWYNLASPTMLIRPQAPPTITWADGDGDWGVPSNWNPNRLPGPSDVVGINTASLHTVTFSNGTSTVRELDVGNDNFTLSGGTLTVTYSASFMNAATTLTISGGTLALPGSTVSSTFNQTGGTLSLIGGALFTNGGSSSGTITVAQYQTFEINPGSNTVTWALSGATISGAGTFEVNSGTINIAAATTISAGFFQTGGIISGTATLTLAGGAGFSYEPAMIGSGTTILQGTSTLSYVSQIRLDGGRVLENQGTLVVSGSSSILLGYNPHGTTVGGGTLQNDVGAKIIFDSKYGSLAVDVDKGTTSFANAGTVENAATTAIFAPFTNTGAVSVIAGTLDFMGGGSSSGTISIASGTTFEISPNSNTVTFTLNGGTISGAGTFELASGTLNTAVTTTISALFDQTGGTISGTNTLTLAGGAQFESGAYDAMTGNGTTILQGTTTLSNASHITLDGGRVLENKGTLTETGALFQLGYNPYGTTVGGGTLRNDAGATINFDNTSFNDAVLVNSGTTSFTNAGTVENTGTATTQIDAPFTNTGTVLVEAGSLNFTGAVTNVSGTTITGGTFEADAGATLSLGASVSIVTDDATLILNGAGSQIQSLETTLTTIGASGKLEVLGSRGYTTTNAITNGGTLQLAGGTFTANKLTDSTGSTLTGFGTVAAAFTNTGLVSVTAGELEINGHMTGGGTVNVASGATFVLNAANSTAANFVDVASGTGTVQLTGGTANDIFA